MEETSAPVYSSGQGFIDYEFIRKYAGTKILLPADTKAAPHPVFLQAHRELMGFEQVSMCTLIVKETRATKRKPRSPQIAVA